MNPRRMVSALVATVVAAVLAAPLSAVALNSSSSWAISSNPLIESSYSSHGYGYGSWKITRTSDGTKSYATGYLKVGATDDYDVYYSMKSQFNSGRCVNGFSLGVDIFGTGGAFGMNYSCTEAFYNSSGWSESTKVPYTTYTRRTAHRDVDPTASIGRARIHVCLGVPWRIDPCTGYNYSGADTY